MKAKIQDHFAIKTVRRTGHLDTSIHKVLLMVKYFSSDYNYGRGKFVVTTVKGKRGMEYFLIATIEDKTDSEKTGIFMCMIGHSR